MEFKNKIFCEDCRITMENMICEDFKVDLILTSPPYNTSKYGNLSNKQKDNRNRRYDVFIEDKSDDSYINWTIAIFDYFDKILSENGVVLYNLGYGNEKNELMWNCVYYLIKYSNFTIVDDIIWKKKNAVPNVSSPNKLTRICEHIFVFCRKSEYMSFKTNKRVINVSKVGQKFYNNFSNFIEASNNDEPCELNKATFSSDLVEQLLSMYVPKSKEVVVYDAFMGTGTTAKGCEMYGVNWVGSEISEAQVEYARNRLKSVQLTL